MLTLTKDANGWLDFILTDDPAKSQADGLAALRQLLDDIAEARTPDESAPEGQECNRYLTLHGNVDLLLRYLHDLRSHAEGADAAFIADVFTAFTDWIDNSGPDESVHWAVDFSDVLELFAETATP